MDLSVPLAAPFSAWAYGNLAEEAGQLGNLVIHANPSQPKLDQKTDGTPCILAMKKGKERLPTLVVWWILPPDTPFLAMHV